ncbi:MAG: hypothetical protein EHM21_00115 [Chloroflexi bacterium]|nr:MAG: hypothetical protein EHM21_00115 [Chloroflexota bacterium]
MAAKKPSKKSSSPMGAVFMDFERDGLDYDIDALARRAVLKHPAVQKRIDKMKDRLSKTANGHGKSGITAMRAEEAAPKTPKNGSGTPAEIPKLKGPAQAVSTRMPRQDKLPKPKRAKASKTSY